MKSIFLTVFSFISFLSCTSQNRSTGLKKHLYTNALIDETSPYLLQHAHNPVDWYPWSESVINKAKKENKLIIVSIGYAACHWCHVMEKESFEDVEVAKLMNENFISIKVDREERPDVDKVYMKAVQLITGNGGWPLNVITLSDGRPIYGGTYFPKNQWKNILEKLSNRYKNNPKELEAYAENLTKAVQVINVPNKADVPDSKMKKGDWNGMMTNWKKNWDMIYGGHKNTPKFMMPNQYDFLMYYSYVFKDSNVERFITTTLNKMALGGLYDQIGGGFSRYATDRKWHIPHFEKMLYDNTQLVSTYASAYQYFKKPLYKNVVLQTLAFMEREMYSKEGLFYTAIDADSEGEEGAYYTWEKPTLQKILGNDFRFFTKYYDLKKSHWKEEKHILRAVETIEDFTKRNKVQTDFFRGKMTACKNKLFAYRKKRTPPKIDNKMLTSTNALAIIAYCKAYRALGKPHLKQQAEALMKTLINKQLHPNQKILYRTFQKGTSKINGYLDDYAFTIASLIEVYQITFKRTYLDTAQALTDLVLKNFWGEKYGLFFFSKNNKLITKDIPITDNVIASGNSVMATNLFSLGLFLGNQKYIKIAKKMFATAKPELLKYPDFHSKWAVLGLQINTPFYEVAVVGNDCYPQSKKLQKFYLPNMILSGSKKKSDMPLLLNRFVNGKTLWYVCKNNTCKLPVDTPSKVREQVLVK